MWKDMPHASCVRSTQRANTQEPRAPALESHLSDRSGVRRANQAPGTSSQAALLVAAPPGFSTHKGKAGESQAEGLPPPPPADRPPPVSC